MKVIAIILSWNDADAVLSCLHTLYHQSISVDVLVVDNASRARVVSSILEKYPKLHLIRNERNLGFAGGMNTGIKAILSESSSYDVAVLINQDVLLDRTCIENLLSPIVADSKVAVVGAKIRYPNGTLQHAGIWLEWPRAIVHHIGCHEVDTGQYNEVKECEFVTGATIALRLSALDSDHCFDEGFWPAYFEDIDLCQRLRKNGWKIVYNPSATLIHQESLSLPDELQRSCYYNRGRLRFVLKHYSLVDLVESFFLAEEAHAQQYVSWPVESQALRWAYAETLLNLRDIFVARRQLDSTFRSVDEEHLVALVQRLQRTHSRVLWRYAHQRADWMFNH